MPGHAADSSMQHNHLFRALILHRTRLVLFLWSAATPLLMELRDQLRQAFVHLSNLPKLGRTNCSSQTSPAQPSWCVCVDRTTSACRQNRRWALSGSFWKKQTPRMLRDWRSDRLAAIFVLASACMPLSVVFDPWLAHMDERIAPSEEEA